MVILINLALDPLLAYAGSTVLFFMWFFAASLILTRKYSLLKTCLIVLFSLVIYFLLPLLPLFSQLRFAVGFLIVAIPVQFLYTERWYQKLLTVVLIFCCMILAEYLLLIILPVKNILDTGDTAMMNMAYAAYLFTNALLLAVLVVISRNLKKQYRSELDSRVYLLFLLFPISQYCSMAGWFTPVDGEELLVSRPTILLFSLFLFVLADVLLALAFRSSLRAVALQTRNSILEQQVAAEQEHYYALAANYDDIRHMRHDIDNHLYTIRALLDDGKTEDAALYASQLSASDLFSPHTLAGCDNPVAASFLLHKKKELEARKIALHIDASVPQKLGITNQDLICGLGNLLDNAAEACSSVPNAEILLSVRYKPPYLQIDITNPLPDHPDKKVPRIPELTRGLGQAILRDLAVRYDGHYQFTRQDGIFHAVLFMKEDSQQEKVL